MLQNRCNHRAASKIDTHLKTPTLFARTPNLNVDESWGAVESNSVKGSRGSRIVFSWTWKENRKKDIELLSNASSTTVCITGGSSVDFFSFLSLSHARIGAMAAPRNPTRVRRVDSRMSALCETQSLHFTTTLLAHQKLATLSSNMPLLNGKMRVMGSRIAEIGASGGRKGRKSSVKVPAVTTARRTNSCALSLVSRIGGKLVGIMRTRLLGPDKGTCR